MLLGISGGGGFAGFWFDSESKPGVLNTYLLNSCPGNPSDFHIMKNAGHLMSAAVLSSIAGMGISFRSLEQKG